MEELLEELKELDEIDLLELLDITSEEIVEVFKTRIVKRRKYLEEKLQRTEGRDEFSAYQEAD